MNFQEWVAARKGRATEVAAHFGVSLSAVSQWMRNGVPVDRMKSVRDLSKGDVSLEDMLPAARALVVRNGGTVCIPDIQEPSVLAVDSADGAPASPCAIDPAQQGAGVANAA